MVRTAPGIAGLWKKKTLLFNILLENSGVYKQGIIDKVNWLTQSHNIYSKFNKTVTKLFEVLVKKNPGRLFAMKWSCAISWKIWNFVDCQQYEPWQTNANRSHSY